MADHPSPAPIEIVPMTAAHLGAVGGLCRQLGYAPEAGALKARFAMLDADTNGLFVAVDPAGGVLGFVHVFRRPMLEDVFCAQIQALAVNEGARRRGAGFRLLAAAEDWARGHGLPRMVLYSRDDRIEAREFYRRAGYDAAAASARFVKDLD